MQFNPSVFKGEVVERVVERPREISQIKQNGLASPAPTWRGKSLGAACNPRSPPTVSQQQPLKPPFPESNNNADDNIGQPQTDTDPVMKQILQMSPDEVQAAQREIAAMFKPKNLEFLKKMALKKSATAMNDRDMNCELQPPQIKQSVTPTNPSSSSANIDVQVKGCMPLFDTALTILFTCEKYQLIMSQIIRDRSHLNILQVFHLFHCYRTINFSILAHVFDVNFISLYVQLALQPASRSSSGTTMTKSTGTVRKLMRSSTDRFDLRGCKVVQKESSIIEISAALQDNSLFKGWSLLKDETDVIARSIVEIMLDVGFAVEHMPLDGEKQYGENSLYQNQFGRSNVT